MITREQLFTNPTTGVEKPHTAAQADAADELLNDANALLDDFSSATGWVVSIDPDTGTQISGSRGGNGGGGFRLDHESDGYSSHKILYVQEPSGRYVVDLSGAKAAVDCFDPANHLDQWLDQFEQSDGRNSKLEEYNLYREHPNDTPGWCHLTKRAPRSGHRTFKP
jgi:hypothetical protein